MGNKRQDGEKVIRVSRVAALLGTASAALAVVALVRCSCAWPSVWSVECLSLPSSAVISAWCAAAAVRWGWFRPPLLSGRGAPWNISAIMQLLRSSLSGGAVAMLGWRALVGERDMVLMALMIAMQLNTTVGAWLVCELQRGDRRSRSPSPTPDVIAETLPRRTGSHTLPRGWRYHKSSGLFEHKRTGRTQRDPPGTAENGVPLCNLPPCDEEHALLDSGSEATTDGESAKRWRSRTWNDGGGSVRKERERSGGMSLWELRDAFRESDGAEAKRRPSGGGSRVLDAV